jgi:hypothetical protein
MDYEVLTCLLPYLSTSDLVQLRGTCTLTRSQIAEPELVIQVKTLTRREPYHIRCSPLHTLDHLMSKIETVIGVPKCLQRIMRCGQQYPASEFTKTLENLGSPTHLQLIMRMVCNCCGKR